MRRLSIVCTLGFLGAAGCSAGGELAPPPGAAASGGNSAGGAGASGVGAAGAGGAAGAAGAGGNAGTPATGGSSGDASSTGGTGGTSGTAGSGGDAALDAEPCDASTPPGTPAGVALIPPYASSYAVFDLGAVAGMPAQKYGGVTLKDGDPDTLLVGGDANLDTGAIYAVPLIRGCNHHIVGFAGPATKFADAPYNDGGLMYGPDGILWFTGYPVNTLGEIAPGATTPGATIDVATLGVASSLGALGFVPQGFAGQGALKLVSWAGGEWYEASIAVNGSGLYDVTAAAAKPAATLGGGPEGFAYVPQGSPQFAVPSMIVSEWSLGSVATYEIDASGDPVVSTRKDFMSGLTGAEGAYFDTETGDYLFSTWNFGSTERIIVVQGFVRPGISGR